MLDIDTNAGRFVRVHFSLEYIVPADRPDMIDEAKTALCEDLESLSREQFIHLAIRVDDAPSSTTASDVPEFIWELCGDEPQCSDND